MLKSTIVAVTASAAAGSAPVVAGGELVDGALLEMDGVAA
jgi:hypothetical protein